MHCRQFKETIGKSIQFPPHFILPSTASSIIHLQDGDSISNQLVIYACNRPSNLLCEPTDWFIS